MPARCAIFDIDGTLVDSNDLHARAWIESFAAFGKQFDFATVRSQIGKGGDLLVPDLLGAREMRLFGDKVKKHRSKLYRDKYLPDVKPFPGVPELFETLAGRGIKLALASSSDEKEVEYYVRLLGVGRFLEGRTSKKDAEFSKPSPEIFSAALERSGAEPKLTFVVGDTPYDILAAHRIALPVVAVRSGGFEEALLAKAEFLFASALEISGRIDEIDAWFDE